MTEHTYVCGVNDPPCAPDGGDCTCGADARDRLLASASAMLDALYWDQRGLAGLTHRARGAFNDLATATGWRASPRPDPRCRCGLVDRIGFDYYFDFQTGIRHSGTSCCPASDPSQTSANVDAPPEERAPEVSAQEALCSRCGGPRKFDAECPSCSPRSSKAATG